MTAVRQWARSRNQRIWLPLRSRARVRNWFENLEDPKPPNPNKLDPEAREEWDDAYEHAKDVYTSGPEAIPNLDEVSRRSAWRAIDMLDGVQWPEDEVLDWEADCIGLGAFLEYGYVDEDGVLQVATFGEPDPPILLWDHERKLMYSFPGVQLVACEQIPEHMREAAEAYETWSKHKAKCYMAVRVPDYQVSPVGLMDSTSYRSDKFDRKEDLTPARKNAQSYFHAHGDDVWVYESAQRSTNGYRGQAGDPRAIMIGGGKLDMRKEGLIH